MSNCRGWTLPFCDTRTRVAVVSGGQTTACWLRLQPTSAEASRARGRIRAVSTERIYGKVGRRSKHGTGGSQVRADGYDCGNFVPASLEDDYLISMTSFSLERLISSIFLISSSVRRWISSSERQSSSSVIFLSLSA